MIKCKHVPPSVRYKHLAHIATAEYRNIPMTTTTTTRERVYYIHTPMYTQAYIHLMYSSLLTTRLYRDGVIRHAIARDCNMFLLRRDSEFYRFFFLFSFPLHKRNTIFFFICSTHVAVLFPYLDASTFLLNPTSCNLWTNHSVDNLIESTWRGRSLFRASARTLCRVPCSFPGQ